MARTQNLHLPHGNRLGPRFSRPSTLTRPSNSTLRSTLGAAAASGPTTLTSGPFSGSFSGPTGLRRSHITHTVSRLSVPNTDKQTVVPNDRSSENVGEGAAYVEMRVVQDEQPVTEAEPVQNQNLCRTCASTILWFEAS